MQSRQQLGITTASTSGAEMCNRPETRGSHVHVLIEARERSVQASSLSDTHIAGECQPCHTPAPSPWLVLSAANAATSLPTGRRAAAVRPSFTYVVKASQFYTHRKRLNVDDAFKESWGRFWVCGDCWRAGAAACAGCSFK